MDRIILHSDINSCFANIECLYNPTLRGKPVSVCGSVEERHGIVLASTIEAKKCGVKTGEAIWQAKQKCPELIVVEPHYDRYVRHSNMSREIYNEYTDLVEPFGLDEAFLDITGISDNGEATAQEIRKRIKEELGVTVSVGVSFNKIFAKLGSDMKKPDAVTVITRENFREKVWPLAANEILGVGRQTEKKLSMLGIHTLGELAHADEHVMQKQLGKMGVILKSFAMGQDISPVMKFGTHHTVKSISNGTTPPRDLKTFEDARLVLLMLCESVSQRMREQGFAAFVVHIYGRDTNLNTFQHQVKLDRPTDISSELLDTAFSLLKQRWSFKAPLRSITVGVSELVPSGIAQQTSIFVDEAMRVKLEKLDTAIDEIRSRFGHYSIMRAVTHLDTGLGMIDARSEHVSYPVGYFHNQ